MIAVLVRLFARPDGDLRECGISESEMPLMREVFRKLVSMVPNGLELCMRLCRGKAKAAQVQRALQTE